MLKFYNTLTKKKEVFKEIEKGVVKIYSCGPTVYSYQHIGNMTSALFGDFLKRTLRYCGFKVIDVMNITDVGHISDDGSEGEDKMLKAAKKEKKDPYEIAEFYTKQYLEDVEKLNVILPKYLPKATDHIKEQIQIIEQLESKGFTYKTSDGVYFDVSKLKDYGKLSGQSLAQKKAGARVKLDREKRNPQDFALWKFLTGDNKDHVMKWESPWGLGFPGWHIECSAMGRKYLGDRFDIHTGGIEHIPVHHENEIAQNEGSGSIRKINYWLHHNHVLVNGEKMAKSLGNVYLLKDLIDDGYSPLAFRELCLRSNYRKQTNFTFDALDSAQANVEKINDFYRKLKTMKRDSIAQDSEDALRIKKLDEFEKALKDDLNTPVALAAVYDYIHRMNKKKIMSDKDIVESIKFMERVDKVLALIEKEEQIPQEIIDLAEDRMKAREKKDYMESDRLRVAIRDKGYEIKDSKTAEKGYILNKI